MRVSEALEIIKPETPTLADVKKAYRRLAKTCHSDVGGEGMTRLNEAMEVLKNNLGKWDPLTAADVVIGPIRPGNFDKCRIYADVRFGDGIKTYPANGIPFPPIGSIGAWWEIKQIIKNQHDQHLYKLDSEANTIRIFQASGEEVSNLFTPAATTLTAELKSKK